MTEPLKSEGRLKVTKDRSSWHMTAPFDVDTIITADGISQALDGGPPQPVTGGAPDIGASIARLVANLVQGQWDALSAYFRVTKPEVPAGSAWTLSLQPIDPQLQAILGTIEVQGCQDISTITVTRADGDHDVISFGTDTGTSNP